MEFETAIITYFLIIILIMLIARYLFHLKIFSSIVLGLTIGIIILCISFPISKIEKLKDRSGSAKIYGIIISLTALIILLYVLWKIFNDRDYELSKKLCDDNIFCY